MFLVQNLVRDLIRIANINGDTDCLTIKHDNKTIIKPSEPDPIGWNMWKTTRKIEKKQNTYILSPICSARCPSSASEHHPSKMESSLFFLEAQLYLGKSQHWFQDLAKSRFVSSECGDPQVQLAVFWGPDLHRGPEASWNQNLGSHTRDDAVQLQAFWKYQETHQ